jgi:uncharacterized membrane protein YfcA
LLILSSIISVPMPLLGGFVLIIAFLYASVGFGGASGYLAVMSLFEIPASIAASTALSLNVVVAGTAFVNYSRKGHLRPRLLWPFVLTSIPAAFLGGTFHLEQLTYQILLNTILFYLGLRLLFAKDQGLSRKPLKIPSWSLALISGVSLGLLSGMLGIGGGVFLSPLILLAGWGDTKQAAASSAGFILLNSISGLAGRASSGTLEYGSLGGILLLLGLVGGLAGSYLGVHYLSHQAIRRILGLVMLIAVVWFLIGWLR